MERAERDRVPYDVWRDKGQIIATPGQTVDYGFVAHKIGERAAQFEVCDLAYDRWRIDLLQSELDARGVNVTLSPFGQGFKEMSPAVEDLESAVLNGTIRVKSNPVLRWNASSAVLEEDPAGNRKFTKRRATGRIDGIVALAMAVHRAMSEADKPRRSVYEERGFITLGM
jgi:phage terminase large subunit-like protein